MYIKNLHTNGKHYLKRPRAKRDLAREQRPFGGLREVRSNLVPFNLGSGIIQQPTCLVGH